MTLFHYQKTKHKRKLSPGPFIRYQTYKKYLRIEFDATCVYCRMPDSLSEVKSYAVEHYFPKDDFNHLENEYSNLFYSCCDCNGRKGTYWPDDVAISQCRFIPNPCDYVMHDHLRSQPDGTVKPHSFAGHWAIELLDLNDPNRIKKRFAFLTLKKNNDNSIAKLSNKLTELKKIEKNVQDAELSSIRIEIAEFENKLAELEEVNKIFGA